MNKAKVCFYSPYLPKHFGGGEKHLFDVALEVAKKYQVYITIDQNIKKSLDEIKRDYQVFLNCSLDRINFVYSPIPNGSFFDKLLWTKQFDYFYYVTDGSLFFSLAKKNILHIQVPFKEAKTFFIDRVKLKNWQIKNTNSEFTKKQVTKAWQTEVQFVHYPKVELSEIDCQKVKKQKVILHVGRFFKQLHSKRQDVLVDIFAKLITAFPKETNDWQLVLVGSVEDESYYQEVLAKVKKINKKYSNDTTKKRIKLSTNVSRKELLKYYCHASIYWHATGFGVDEVKYPEKMEHFGITTIEAMASGCVPVVYGQGGQPEILGSSLKQLLWQTKDECIDATIDLIKNVQHLQSLSKQVTKRVVKFDQDEFSKQVWEMFKK